MVQVSLRLPEELLAKVDSERGDVPRNVWIRRAVEREAFPLVGATSTPVVERSPSPERKSKASREPAAETELPKIARRHWA